MSVRTGFTTTLGIAGLLMTLAYATPAHSAVLASSTFDTSADGWMVGNIDNAAQAMEAPAYHSTGGNPAGYISTTDDYDIVGFFAPATFLGNQSAAYGGTFGFDLYDTSVDSGTFVMLLLYGAGLVVSVPSSPPSTSNFTHFSYTLSESASFDLFTPGAGNDSQGSTPPSHAQFQNVLANLTNIAIDADWHTGVDLTSLDNVVLTSGSASVVEPATLSVIGSGLIGLGLIRRRRN